MNAIAKTGGAGFALQPRNITEAMQMADMLSKSQMVPKHYQNKPQDTLVAMMMGSELGLNPIQALQNIAVINGKPSIYGDAMLALVQNHPAFGGIQESFDEVNQVATCTVWRKGGEKHTVTFSQADAKQAGLWGKSGPWSQYPKRMMTFRARGFGLRDQFADALAGLISREEAEDMPVRDMGEAKRQEPVRPALEHYAEDSFATNFPKWQSIVESGKKTAGDIVAMLESKAVLSAEQREQILAQKAVVPLFTLEFTGVDSPSNQERLLKYKAKREKALTCFAGEARVVEASGDLKELSKVFALLTSISDTFAAEADAVIDWARREVAITIDEGGKTIYAASLQLDSEAIEAKARLVRHEIERMKVAALAGLKGAA